MSTCRIVQPVSSVAEAGRARAAGVIWLRLTSHLLRGYGATPAAGMAHHPLLPGLACQSLPGAFVRAAGDFGTEAGSAPAGLMSAYGDCRNPLAWTRTRRRWPIPPAAVRPMPASERPAASPSTTGDVDDLGRGAAGSRPRGTR